MGTNTDDPTPDRDEVFTGLFETLCLNRRGDHQGRMARALLRLDGTDRNLVALIDDAQRAVYHEAESKCLKGYQFDKHGVRAAHFDTLWRLVDDVASWVDAHQDDCQWVHPRFRWVLDVPEDETEWGYRIGV